MVWVLGLCFRIYCWFWLWLFNMNVCALEILQKFHFSNHYLHLYIFVNIVFFGMSAYLYCVLLFIRMCFWTEKLFFALGNKCFGWYPFFSETPTCCIQVSFQRGCTYDLSCNYIFPSPFFALKHLLWTSKPTLEVRILFQQYYGRFEVIMKMLFCG